MYRGGMDTSKRTFPWRHLHSPIFFPSRWERLLNWDRNPGGVILKGQTKCPGQCQSGQHQDGDTDPVLGEYEDPHRSNPSLGLLPLPRSVCPGTGNWGRT